MSPLTTPPSRSRAARVAATIAAVLAVSACATNPVTGRRELALVSKTQEIQMGQQSAQEVAQSIGLVDDKAVQDYVQRVGAALAAKSQRPELPWQFRVVDDPTPNAFALPGGFIFVTRGLMGAMRSEAELASVLGHEIGHVTARHSVQQISQQQLAQLGLGLGSILSPTVAKLGDVAGAGLQLLFLKYSRDDERQADNLGFEYALNGGYDVREMADVFTALQRFGDASGQSPLPSYLATHPDPGQRVQTVQKKIAQLGRPLTGTKVDEPDFLARVDGLVYGENPRNGFFQGSTFAQPDLKFRITFPSGWKTQNTPQAVIAESPQNDGAIQLTLAQTNSADAAAQQFLGQQGLQAGQPTRETVNGIPAISSYFDAQTDQGALRGLAVFFDFEGRTYQVIAFAPAQRFSAYDATFRRVLGSFAKLTDPTALAVQPARITLVTLPSAMTLTAFNQRYPSTIPVSELAIINQVPSESTTLPAGTVLKRVTAKR